MGRWSRWAALAAAAAVALSGCSLRPGETETAGPDAETVPALTLPVPAEEEPDPLRERMEAMTLREKVGQLFLVRPDALDPDRDRENVNRSDTEGVTELTDAMRAVLAAYPVGGVVLFGKNIRSPEQLRTFSAQLRSVDGVPLFLAVDEEGGDVARLANTPGFGLTRFESAAAVGDTDDTDNAFAMGAIIGDYLHRYGFQLDLAPVADVNTNPDNPVIGRRAFSDDPALAAAMAGAFARGLASRGVIPTLKHFPGHGDTAEDSHRGLAVTEKTREELEACEWLPYRRNDLTGWCVMAGHIAAPMVTGDRIPASLNPALVTGCLREELGFDGLVITDSMAMYAITADHSPGEAALLALEAGCDVILMPDDLEDAFETVAAAVEDGRLSEERLEESVYRILRYKAMAGMI